MNWIPQSLLSRSVLLISALLVVSQLIWFGLYRSYNVRTQSEYLAQPDCPGVISTLERGAWEVMLRGAWEQVKRNFHAFNRATVAGSSCRRP